jgi:hypothetical protein
MARQYNLKNFNGIHLKSPYDYDSYNTNGISALIENFDLYPLKSTDITDFHFINSSIRLVDQDSIYYGKILGDGFIGDNLYVTRTHDLTYSQIRKDNELVKGEKYFNDFNFYFNFNGTDASGFDIGSTGYTINVSLYVILGNTKRKLKLTDLRVYDYTNPTYSGTKDNPVDAGYKTMVVGSIYDNKVNIVSDNIVMSFLPKPRAYDIYNNMGITTGSTISYSYVEGDSGSINYGNGISTSIGPSSVMRRISFSKPEVYAGPGINTPDDYQVIDVGFEPSEIAPFDVMSGPLFRVTASLDVSSELEFDSNICTGNKEYKILVDYNGTMSKTIITYEMDTYMDEASSLPTALPA